MLPLVVITREYRQLRVNIVSGGNPVIINGHVASLLAMTNIVIASKCEVIQVFYRDGHASLWPCCMATRRRQLYKFRLNYSCAWRSWKGFKFWSFTLAKRICYFQWSYHLVPTCVKKEFFWYFTWCFSLNPWTVTYFIKLTL